MSRRRRRRRDGRFVPVMAAVLTGLAVAVVAYWYLNPGVEWKLPEVVADRLIQRGAEQRVPESFAAIEATSAPPPDVLTKPTDPPPASGLPRQLRQLAPQVNSGSQEERRARAEMEASNKVSELEFKVHAGINAERAKNGSALLDWDDRLATVARAHSDDMTSRGYFSHDTPEGLGPSERITRSGYSCWKGTHYGVAENITVELVSGSLESIANDAVGSWMNSSGHRTNLLGRQYDRTGIGASFGRWQGYRAVYLTQVFC